MSLVLYGVFLAHFMAYKEQYAHIGVMFSITVIMKILAKVGGSKEQSDLIAMGGGALTGSEFIKLLKEIGKGGMTGATENKNGLVSDIMKSIMESLK